MCSEEVCVCLCVCVCVRLCQFLLVYVLACSSVSFRKYAVGWRRRRMKRRKTCSMLMLYIS